MKLLFTLAKGIYGWLLLAVCAGLISGLSNASLLALINSSIHLPDDADLLRPGGQFLLLMLAMLSGRLISQTTFMYLGQRLKATLRSQVTHNSSEAAWRDMEKTGVSRVLAVVTQDLDTLVVLFVNLPNLLIYSAVIGGSLIYLGFLSLPVLAMAIVAMLLGGLGYHFTHRQAIALLHSSRNREATLIEQIKNLFDGGREYKLNPHRRRRFVQGALAENIEQVRVERTRGYVLFAWAAVWGSLLFFLFIGSVLFLLRGYISLDPAVLTGYTLVFLYMIVPVEGLLGALPTIGSARIALQRIEEIRRSLTPEALRSLTAPPALESLELCNVLYHYRGEDDKPFVLGPLNVSFQPGELVFITGGNGSGKTTFAHLLVGLYPPDAGEIILNGSKIAPQDWEVYRQHFSAIFNDFFLFDEIEDPSEAVIKKADSLLQRLRLDQKVSLRDGRFSTIALSQGQRKRLALLLVWLESRPFCLFDEWAADQDPEFKAFFYTTLLPMLKAEGKTVVVITHDDRYFQLADRLLKLEMGQWVPLPSRQ
ncbi:cyclic peptide transporter [Izhakiella australiensis]|uniref:ABC-type xenobiotic transporter n=1 Tax=Izhakiella australiensis TaxID=1926881 RepID=A0A1S8YE01_9GAMM|nr:cyclic peptide export ABC transporter [Izhakiella australiensis]OON36988.1 cyclic peptide transporter [Izhakiella australiensis]